MSTETRRIEIRGIPIEIVRKPIKNLHVGVYPPNGRVRVAVPLRLTEEAVRLAVLGRLAWIRRRQAEFAAQDRQSRRELVSGESHYFRGRRYRLDVVENEGPAAVKVRNQSTIQLLVRPGASRDQREAVLLHWYREALRRELPALLDKWQTRVGVVVNHAGIKRMRTRWGSCNAEAHRIWLNLELAKKAPACLEYVLVHEMVHLRERHHNERFRDWMDRLLPTWRARREELNRAPLAHEDWLY